MPFLSIAIILRVGIQPASVGDFYPGNYPVGTTAYLMKNSVKKSVYDRKEGDERYDCWVKIVNPNADDYGTTHYTITYLQVLTMTRDGNNLYTLKTQKSFFENNPVEQNLAEYINRHYRDPYGKMR